MHDSIWILVVILVAGLLGGWANYYEIDNTTSTPVEDEEALKPFLSELIDGIRKPNPRRIRCILLSVIAAACVPLFLRSIQSDLLKDAAFEATRCYVLLGFCLLASLYSRRFLLSVGEKALELASENRTEVAKVAKEVRKIKEVSPILNEDDPIDIQAPLVDSTGNFTPDAKMIKVLETLCASNYRFRTIHGVAKDADLKYNKANGYLSWLKQKFLVNQSSRKNGVRWYITAAGLKYTSGKIPPNNLDSEPSEKEGA